MNLPRVLDSRAAIGRFGQLTRLSVRQRRKWLEMLFSLELRNSYDVFDQDQQAVLKVAEVGTGLGALLLRVFLGTARPFTASVVNTLDQTQLLELKRPFRFIFHELQVRAGGELLGKIVRRWSWFRRIYAIEDASGRELATLFGPFFRPWTFELRQGERVLGAIRKRWGGVGRELFSDADNFAVELEQVSDAKLRTLTFAATVLVDVIHFERAK